MISLRRLCWYSPYYCCCVTFSNDWLRILQVEAVGLLPVSTSWCNSALVASSLWSSKIKQSPLWKNTAASLHWEPSSLVDSGCCYFIRCFGRPSWTLEVLESLISIAWSPTCFVQSQWGDSSSSSLHNHRLLSHYTSDRWAADIVTILLFWSLVQQHHLFVHRHFYGQTSFL